VVEIKHGELVPASASGTFRIADLPDFEFWATAKSIGSTDDEAKAIARGEVSPARVAEIEMARDLAFTDLFYAATTGRA
jgi:hypothetical protein